VEYSNRLRVVVLAALTMLLAATLPVAGSHASDDPGVALQPRSSRQPAGAAVQSVGTDVGRIRIPAIDLVDTIRAGVSLSVINEGVSHWVGTASPGDPGNVVLAGHRTTYSAPFYHLDRLDEGDLVYVTDAAGFEVIYRVSETLVVEPADIWITYETGASMVTMFACHPKGSARYRIVVRAEQVAGRRIA
jgi:sortase A